MPGKPRNETPSLKWRDWVFIVLISGGMLTFVAVIIHIASKH